MNKRLTGTLLAVSGVALIIAALGFASVAQAEPGPWKLGQRETETSRWGGTDAFLMADGEQGRVTIRAPKGRVTLDVTTRCNSNDYKTSVSREYPIIRMTSRGVRRLIVRMLPVTMREADCSFIVSVDGRNGTLRVQLDVREHVRPDVDG